MSAFQKKLKLDDVVPYLDLPSDKGGHVSLWDLKQQKNVVLFFNHGTACAHCAAKIEELALAFNRFQDHRTVVLAVSFETVQELKSFSTKVGVPFHLLSDEKGETTERFTYVDPERKAPFPSIFITDRFGVLRFQQIASEAHELISVEEILSWLLLIETECPECSHL